MKTRQDNHSKNIQRLLSSDEYHEGKICAVLTWKYLGRIGEILSKQGYKYQVKVFE